MSDNTTKPVDVVEQHNLGNLFVERHRDAIKRETSDNRGETDD